MVTTPPKLLLLTTDLNRGGTPIVVRELAMRLRARSHHVEVACLAPLGEIGSELQSASIPVHPLNALSQTDLAVLSRLTKLIRTQRYTHVYSLLLHANAIAAAASLLLPKNIRWFQSIQTTQPNPAWHWCLQSIIQCRAEKIIVPSPSVATIARTRCHVPDERLTLIPNALDPADWSLPRIPPQARTWSKPPPAPKSPVAPPHATRVTGVPPVSGLQAEDPPSPPPVTWASSPCETTLPLTTDLLFLGRLDPIKRIPDLIAALRLLTPCPYPLPPFSLHICGEGPDVPRLQQLRQANPDLDIHLHAFSLTPHQALAQADILILPSQAEGFGLVLIEAMAAGVPVIASDAPGIRDVVSHDTTGLLYPTGDTQALANAIQRLTQDPQLRARLTTAARAKVESTYAWNRVLPMYEDALRLTPP